ETQSHVRDAHTLRENPGIATRRDRIAELQVDGVGIEVDPLEHVLRARLHVARRHTRVEPGPAADHGFDAVSTDHDAGAIQFLAPTLCYADVPALVAVAGHRGRLGTDQHRRASRGRLPR